MKWHALLALLAVAALPAPATAEIPVSPLADIYASYNDCFKVATKDGMKPDALAALGWSKATVSKDGRAIADAPDIYGHARRKPIILLSAQKGEGICIVMARLESVGAFEEFKKGWGGKLPKPDAEGAISFFAEGHPIQLRQTGSADKPSMSIMVGTPMKSD